MLFWRTEDSHATIMPEWPWLKLRPLLSREEKKQLEKVDIDWSRELSTGLHLRIARGAYCVLVNLCLLCFFAQYFMCYHISVFIC